MNTPLNYSLHEVASTVETPVAFALSNDEFVAEQVMEEGNPYQAGHYPEELIYPGVFLVESVLNALRCYFITQKDRRVKLAEIESARFMSPGHPGSAFRITATVHELDEKGWRVRATCTAGENKLATVVLRVVMDDTGEHTW